MLEKRHAILGNRKEISGQIGYQGRQDGVVHDERLRSIECSDSSAVERTTGTILKKEKLSLDQVCARERTAPETVDATLREKFVQLVQSNVEASVLISS
jgi:hypothetical protein